MSKLLDRFLTAHPFDKLTEKQSQAISFILYKLSISQMQSLKQQSYLLATIKIESADTYEPVKEGYYLTGNRKLKLYNYYKEHNPDAIKTIFPNNYNGINYLGRGFVQITHDYNYKKFGDLLRMDLLGNPDLALVPDVAWQIAEQGMTKGLFTGKKLSDYFNEEESDWYRARRIINGLDRAIEISEMAQKIYHCISVIEDIPPPKPSTSEV